MTTETVNNVVAPLVLVVDDNDLERMLLRYALEGAEFRVTEASGGDDALKALSNTAVDICVVDGNMPGMDGFELCAHLRSDDSTRKLPVLMLTGLEGEDVRARAFAAGANAFLTKSPDFGAVVAKVGELLQDRPTEH